MKLTGRKLKSILFGATPSYDGAMRAPPPGFNEAELTGALSVAWDFHVVELHYLPVGFGSHHWAATDARGARRFVTVDQLADRDASAVEQIDDLQCALTTATALREIAGLSFVVAPLPATDGGVLQRIATEFTAAVYPFLAGQPYPEGEASTSQARLALVRLLAQVHLSTPLVQTFAKADDLLLQDRSHLEGALGALDKPWNSGPFAERTRQLLKANIAEVHALLVEFDRLVSLARSQGAPWVVTHGEPKPDNFLVTDAGPVLFDWDTARLAPVERDLWLIAGSPSDELEYYRDLTGHQTTADGLELFRLRWELADIASYVRWFRGPHAETADTQIAWGALSAVLETEKPQVRRDRP